MDDLDIHRRNVSRPLSHQQILRSPRWKPDSFAHMDRIHSDIALNVVTTSRRSDSQPCTGMDRAGNLPVHRVWHHSHLGSQRLSQMEKKEHPTSGWSVFFARGGQKIRSPVTLGLTITGMKWMAGDSASGQRDGEPSPKANGEKLRAMFRRQAGL